MDIDELQECPLISPDSPEQSKSARRVSRSESCYSNSPCRLLPRMFGSRLGLTILLLTCFAVAVLVVYSSSRPSLSFIRAVALKRTVAFTPSLPDSYVTYADLQQDNFAFFQVNSSDVIVFLHVQKTGGTTFGRHLVLDIDLQKPCKCRTMKKKRKKGRNRLKRMLRCDCFRPGSNKNWLFSRHSTGWKCGLHADWTELTSCVDSFMRREDGTDDYGSSSRNGHRYFYVTFLREPVARFLSEFRHVQRGATWKGAAHVCARRPHRLPRCYKGEDWSDARLDEFMSCPHNLAINRQTRMLADLTLIDCYNKSSGEMSQVERDRLMLTSAKANLKSMAFFGLTEMQAESQRMFESTFNLKFNVKFEQFDRTQAGKTENALDPSLITAIERLNSLDVELYAFAQSLLRERIQDIDDEEEEDDEEERSRKVHISFDDIEKEAEY